jgi:phage/plasmid-like protein (TIGR03299 family)
MSWKETGIKITINDDLATAMEEANILFHVEVKQGYFKSGDSILHEANGYKYIVRTDTNAALGQCKTKFVPLQNGEAFAFFQPLLNERVCSIDTIGCIDGGRKVWILAEINGAMRYIAGSDRVAMYLLLVNAHDGSTQVMVGVVPIRVWCSNMFSMLNKGDFEIIKFKHTGDPAEKLKLLKTRIEETMGSVDEFVSQLQFLTKVWPTPEELQEYFERVFKIKKDASTKSLNKIERLKVLFVQGTGNQAIEVRGTWYAALNAITEYLNFEAGRNPETRLNSLWFGANKDINSKAIQIALEMCSIGEEKQEVSGEICTQERTSWQAS